MESHELTSAVMNIENTLQEILSVLRETQEFKQVDVSNILEVAKPKKQPKETNKEIN